MGPRGRQGATRATGGKWVTGRGWLCWHLHMLEGMAHGLSIIDFISSGAWQKPTSAAWGVLPRRLLGWLHRTRRTGRRIVDAPTDACISAISRRTKGAQATINSATSHKPGSKDLVYHFGALAYLWRFGCRDHGLWARDRWKTRTDSEPTDRYTLYGAAGRERQFAPCTPHHTPSSGLSALSCNLDPTAHLRKVVSQERNVLDRLFGSLGLEISPFRPSGRLRYSVTTTPCCCIMSLSVSRSKAPALLQQVEGRHSSRNVADPECRCARRRL